MTPPNNTNGFHSNGNGNGYYNGYNGHSPLLNGSQQNQPDEDEIDLKHLFYLLWNHKLIIVTVTALCTVLAGVVAWQMTPIYQSDGSIMITESQGQLGGAGGSDLSAMMSSSFGIGMGSTVADELQILQSRSLSEEVADTLMKIRLMDNGRQFPVTFNSYPEDSSLARKDSIAHRLRQNISFSQADREAKLINVSYKSPAPLEAAKVINLTIESYSQLSTRQNRKSANAAVSFLEKERKRIEDQLNESEKHLQQFMDENELVQVTEQVTSMIEQMANLEQRRQEARTSLVAVNSAIDQYEQQLGQIKPGLAEQYADAIGPNMTRLQYQLAELKTERMQLISKNPELENNPSLSSRLQELNRQIKGYEGEIRSQTEKLLSQSDQYLGFLGSQGGNITQTISELNQKLIELKVEQQQYQSQNEVLTAEIDGLNSVFEDLPENMTALARLKRNVKVNEELYLTVSKQHAEMALWQQTQFGQGQLVDEGYVPELPVEPNKKLFVLVGFVLGGILSVGYVFVKEAFNNNIDGVQKLKELGPPVLSVIPNMQKHIDDKHGGKEQITVQGRTVNTSLVSLLETTTPMAESFRRLEANIIHSNPDQSLKALMVTSTRKGEGKSTILANLGIALAESGQSVIVVDTDLRRPNVDNMFSVRRSPGIVDVLFESVSLKEAVQSTVVSNLEVLSAGQKPPSPTAITKSASFKNLLNTLKEQYDWVLLDTAPYGIITDASSFINEADGVLVVAEFGETETGEMQHTLDALKRVNANVLGTVLNRFKADISSDHYYGANSYYSEYYEDYKEYEKTSF